MLCQKSKMKTSTKHIIWTICSMLVGGMIGFALIYWVFHEENCETQYQLWKKENMNENTHEKLPKLCKRQEKQLKKWLESKENCTEENLKKLLMTIQKLFLP